MFKTFLTEQQVADVLRISQAKLRQDRYYNRGLPYVKVGKLVRYEYDAVMQSLSYITPRYESDVWPAN